MSENKLKSAGTESSADTVAAPAEEETDILAEEAASALAEAVKADAESEDPETAEKSEKEPKPKKKSGKNAPHKEGAKNKPAETEEPETPPTPMETAKALAAKYGPGVVKFASYLIPIAIFVYIVYYMLYYITTAFKGEFHADCTDTILWANASIEGGAVFDKDFAYACFLPFGMNVVMQPLIMIFGLGMKAHIWGMTCYFILLTGFLCLMLREMRWDIRDIALGASAFLALTTSSAKLREIFWQHTIYYTLGVLFIVIGAFLYFRMLNLIEKRGAAERGSKKDKLLFLRSIIVFAILCVFIMLTATDGISALSIFAYPFIAAIFAEWFIDTDNKIFTRKSARVFLSAGTFFFMTVLGGKLLNKWAGDMKAGYQEAYSNFSPMGNWTDNGHAFPLAWMKLNGVQDLGWQPLSDKDGKNNLIYIAGALILLVIPIIATCFYGKLKEYKAARMFRILILTHWASAAMVLMGYIFGMLSSADWRLTPIVSTSILISIIFVHWAISTKARVSRFIVFLCAPLILVCMKNIKNIKEIPSDSYKDNNLFGLAEYLEDEDLTYGYATFWNANSITLISDSKVKVRDVTVDDYGVNKRIYQSSTKWYEDQEDQKNYFLLLSDSEYGVLESLASPLIDEATNINTIYVNDAGYKILVFDHNIF